MSRILLLFFLVLNILEFQTQLLQLAAQPGSFMCLNNGNYTRNSEYANNLNSLLYSVPNNVGQDGFYQDSVGWGGPDTANVVALCRADVQLARCRSCIRNCIPYLQTSCPGYRQAFGWADNCMLRYSNETLTGTVDVRPTLFMWNTQNATSPDRFMKDVKSLLINITDQAANSTRRIAAANMTGPDFQYIFALVQCTPDLGPDNCNRCLTEIYSDVRDCCDRRRGARVVAPSCSLRYEAYPFYNITRIQEFATSSNDSYSLPAHALFLSDHLFLFYPDSTRVPHGQPVLNCLYRSALSYKMPLPLVSKYATGGVSKLYQTRLSSPDELERAGNNTNYNTSDGNNTTRTTSDGSNTTRTIIAVVASVVACFVLAAFAWALLQKRMKLKQENTLFEDESIEVESLRYTLATLKDATNDFSEENKLGQGGFGAVYKGILLNGREIAVKRLSRNSGQGDLEFKNEVLLLANLQHRNLVRLVGFCLEGTERILIYEFMENASLDHFIFDQVKRSDLNWEKRYNIIGGVARGLLYLHEDSQLKIIHRDLKPNNILLDGSMNPKIADFGMARLFGQDETHGDTGRIAGTIGYMAPEYAMHGQISTKLDVFSFGVLTLEIISGRRKNYFQRGENVVEDLLSSAWKNWREGTPEEIVDPCLNNSISSFVISDMLRCIQIALLCVQENAIDRPTMASVVLMLSSSTLVLAEPSEPAFYMPSGYGSETSSLIQEHNSRSSKYTSSSKSVIPTQLSDNSSSRNDVSISDFYPR
ncbi:cysteine-rich receptor-like protein kinase 29 [Striga asiatica]|uniref:Cysteine-rich receptor-like protein kinase 29 n=1 Tax=Striga asiatica TaxID=4170 RepID=A0A5A7P429_STRAF|nr:cysteine-rich receptor-like protein kinase 29 [Striga asiatica]